MSLTLEDFETITADLAASAATLVTPAQAEADRMAAYEQGYQAGWDDAVRAEAQDQSRIGADFAGNLQELSFTFHEARAHVIGAIEPLLNELIGTLLPGLVAETLGLTILEELRPLIEAGTDQTIELVVAPASRPALEKQLAEASAAAVRLTEEPTLAEGQVFLRVGRIERRIDTTGALDRITAAVRSFYALNEGTLKHA